MQQGYSIWSIIVHGFYPSFGAGFGSSYPNLINGDKLRVRGISSWPGGKDHRVLVFCVCHNKHNLCLASNVHVVC